MSVAKDQPAASGRPVEPDIKTHMLATYKWLRWMMAGVAFVFLVTLALYKAFGREAEAVTWQGQPVLENGMPVLVVRNSISAYYHHPNHNFPMQVLFAGAFASIGLLLIAYQGYTNCENWVLNASGAALLGVLFFPMDWPEGQPETSPRQWGHVACALIFFAGLAYVCIFRARDTLRYRGRWNRWVRTYRNLYWIVGGAMASLPLLWLGVFRAISDAHVYMVEVAGVVFFMSYWVIKSIELWSIGLEEEGAVDRLEATAKAESGQGGAALEGMRAPPDAGQAGLPTKPLPDGPSPADTRPERGK